MVTSNYVLLETTTLVQNRLGFDALATLHADVLPVMQVEWVDTALHQAAAAILITIRQRDLSLVDCTSFELMRRLGLRSVFGFDRHFAGQGFTCLP
jgi:predicted nucleic acid-binding protein